MEANLDRAILPRTPNELTSSHTAGSRILSAMVASSLALAKEVAPANVDLDALVREGKQFQREQGMTAEDIQAFQLFYKSAVAGHAEAKFLVFQCYSGGHGVQEDRNIGVEWLYKSAEAGYVGAQYVLARLYSFGFDFPRDRR